MSISRGLGKESVAQTHSDSLDNCKEHLQENGCN